ncbi:MAG: hypothetical protein JNL62_17185, partial [Bryobacterales bacterium]|nr:hypothetical protein [Bryobacterales bacterium]
MTAERWQRVYALYEKALDVSPETRDNWLREHSGDDPETVQEVIRLLALGSKADSFLEVSASSLLEVPKDPPPVFDPGDLIAGRYRIDGALSIGFQKSNITLRGQGESTVIDCRSSNYGIQIGTSF